MDSLDQLVEQSRELQGFTSRKKALVVAITELESKKKKLTAEVETLERQLEPTKEGLAKYSKEAAAAKAAHRQQIESLTDRIAALNAELATAKDELAKIKLASKQREEAADEYAHDAMTQADAQAKDLVAQAKRKLAEAADEMQEATDLSLVLGQRRQKLDEREGELMKRESAVERRAGRLDVDRKSIATQLTDVRRDRKEVDRLLKAAKAKDKAATEKFGRAQLLVEQLENQLSEGKTEAAERTKQLNQREKALDKRAQMLDDLHKRLEATKQKQLSEREAIAAAKKELGIA